MGERISSISPSFNRSIHLESRPERLSSEAGSLLLREADERLGLSQELSAKLKDRRDPRFIQHSMRELLRTAIILPALGWRDQDDADFLRNDPAVNLSISDEKGVHPLTDKAKGLASQPTLSRLHDALSSDENRAILHDFIMESAARRIKADNNGHRQRRITLDIDSIPVEVDGHQPGAEFNGYYDAKIFHPLIATAAESRDILGVRLRPGNVHTADGGLDFILAMVKSAREKLCQVAAVRMDAGFPDEETLKGLEDAGIPYVARIKNNKVLDVMAEPYLTRPVGRPSLEPRTWTIEMAYQAESWTRSRRIVLVVVEEPRELFLRHFWIVTSWLESEKDGESLISYYRERGAAEGVFGEFMDSIAPALSANKRPKSHYRGRPLNKPLAVNLSFAINEVRLILAALSHNLAHSVRTVAEKAFGVGMSIKRLRERYLRVAVRFTLHARRIIVILSTEVSERWESIWDKMKCLDYQTGR